MIDVIRLLLATRNAHKRREFKEILGGAFALEDLRGHPEIDEVVEDGATFEENARLKAMTVSRQLPGLVMADDSGLEVDSLGGAPGIYSARYAGEGATEAANRQKLLGALAHFPAGAERRARFRCVLVLARGGQALGTFEGAVEGEIMRVERGTDGFGYDSIFRANGFRKTFAELSTAEKNAISHRAAAAKQLRAFLQTASRSS
jgi:XTP/dITP diphosphohydrolase